MIEVGLGGDMTAAAEADEWVEAYEFEKGKRLLVVQHLSI